MATTTSNLLSRQFTSFSGTDIRVVANGTTLGTIQALSYAIQREKGPVYVMGSPDPLSFSRGKRGIAGTMITLMMDRHPLFRAPFNQLNFLSPNDQIFPISGNPTDATFNELNDPATTTFTSNDVSANYTVTRPWYLDQIPPLDIVAIGCNEYGNASMMRIYGAEFLNEGSGFSVDDMVIENQTTYICRSILPWTPMGQWDLDGGGFQEQIDPNAIITV